MNMKEIPDISNKVLNKKGLLRKEINYELQNLSTRLRNDIISRDAGVSATLLLNKIIAFRDSDSIKN
jgi:hypothetical protein